MKMVRVGLFCACVLALFGAFRTNHAHPDAPTITAIPFPTSGIAGEPHLTTSPTGTVYSSWIERRDDKAYLMMSSLQGDAWTPASEVASGSNWFVNWADVPSLTVASNGRMMAHWLERLGDGKYAYGVRYSVSANAGKTWATAEWLHADRSESEHGFASVVAHKDGFMAVWLDGKGYAGPEKAMALNSRTIGFDGTMGPEVLLDARTCDCCPTTLTPIGDGRIVALYRGRTPDEVRDIQAVFWQNGTWSEPVTVSEDHWQINACPVNGPSIHANGRRFVASWFTAAGGEPKINASLSEDGGFAFGDPIRLDLGHPVGRVASRMRSVSEAAVLWIEGSGSTTNGLLLKTISQSGAVSEPIQIAPISEGRSSGYPRMEVDGESLIVMWTAATEPATIQTARVSWK